MNDHIRPTASAHRRRAVQEATWQCPPHRRYIKHRDVRKLAGKRMPTMRIPKRPMLHRRG